MSARKWIVRVLLLALLCATAIGGVSGCESTGGGGYRGSDGHVGHNH